MGWTDLIGLAFPVLLPAFFLWANITTVKELFKKDNKTVFKTLSYFLLGAIAWAAFGIWFQEQKKVDPNIGWVLLGTCVVITGGILVVRGMEKGWKKAFTFPQPLWDQIQDKYILLIAEENARWEEFEASSKQGKAVIDDLRNQHFKRIRELYAEQDAELAKASGVKKREDWVLLAFYYLLAFVVFGLLGQVWDLVYDWVITFPYVKGRPWVANGSMIGAILLALGLVFGIFDEQSKKK
jgi:hypothetical protein